jgi:hypothetical protein
MKLKNDQKVLSLLIRMRNNLLNRLWLSKKNLELFNCVEGIIDEIELEKYQNSSYHKSVKKLLKKYKTNV